MGNTVYLNHHFTPKNQTCFYHSNLREWKMIQEEMSNLILEKMTKQYTMMHKQYQQVLFLTSKNEEQYDEVKDKLTKLQRLTKQNTNLTNTNQQIILDVFHTLKPFTELVEETLKENGKANQQLKDHQGLLSTKVQELENHLMQVEQLGKSLYQGQQDMLSQMDQKQINLKNDIVSALHQMKEKLAEKTGEQWTNKLQDLQENIVANNKEMKEDLEKYLKEATKDSLHDLLKSLNPGTKVNKIIIAGLEVEVHTFINYDQITKQVKWMKKDRNLIITNSADIQAIEVKTRKQAEDS